MSSLDQLFSLVAEVKDRADNQESLFEDIIWLSDKEIQKIIRGRCDIVVTALSHADDEVRSKVLRCMSRIARKKAERALSDASRFNEEDSLRCQKIVVEKMLALRSKGKVSFYGDEDEVENKCL